MIRVEIEHTFAVSVGEAFGYITDTGNWAEYWPDFVRVQDPASARWTNPGDEITIVLKLLGRERAMHMKLKEFQTNALVTYVSNQRGLPDARHERYFKAVSGGVQYRVVVGYEPSRLLKNSLAMSSSRIRSAPDEGCVEVEDAGRCGVRIGSKSPCSVTCRPNSGCRRIIRCG
jgi:hypothetical protein